MSRLKLTFAGVDYDKMHSLAEGLVKPEGIDLNFVPLSQGAEVNYRMLRYREFDASEMSMGSYIASLFQENPPFIAIPVYPFRMFRHASIFVNSRNNIKSPKDIISKKVGNPRYQQTACIWMRGIMAERYGVPISSVTYFQGGEEEPGRWEGLPLDLSKKGIKLKTVDKSLSSMLENGEIDALYSSRIPSPMLEGSKNIQRLFPDFVSEEKKYFKETGIYPIMHTVVVRKAIYEENPWIAQSLFKAFVKSKEATYDEFMSIKGLPAVKSILPWLGQYLQEIRDLMGWDFAPYGVEPNRTTLETFLRYCYDQGIAQRLLKPEEIFAPESVEQFKV
jgi:4,5-dihydroxyphthalate decarboxylase